MTEETKKHRGRPKGAKNLIQKPPKPSKAQVEQKAAQAALKAKQPRKKRFTTPDNIPKLPTVIVYSIEEEEEVYYSNLANDQYVKICYAKNGRGNLPRLPIARREFRKLCQFLPRGHDLCAWFKVDEDTLNSWTRRAFPDLTFKNITQLVTQLGSNYTFGLRRFLWSHAERSPNAAIFLAKNYLSLRESPQDETSTLQVETINYHFPKGKDVEMWKGPPAQIDAQSIHEAAESATNGTEATTVTL